VGAPQIHSELLKLGIELGRSTLAKYMTARRPATVARLEDIPSQSYWCDRVARHVRCSDDFVSAIVWISFPAAFDAGNSAARPTRASEFRMDCYQLTEACGWRNRLSLPRFQSGLPWRPNGHHVLSATASPKTRPASSCCAGSLGRGAVRQYASSSPWLLTYLPPAGKFKIG